MGSVVFVGGGPGDPGLLTLHAVEALAQADAVVIDHEGQRALLSHAPSDVEVVDGGSDGRVGAATWLAFTGLRA
jgi:siroheme synthase